MVLSALHAGEAAGEWLRVVLGPWQKENRKHLPTKIALITDRRAVKKDATLVSESASRTCSDCPHVGQGELAVCVAWRFRGEVCDERWFCGGTLSRLPWFRASDMRLLLLLLLLLLSVQPSTTMILFVMNLFWLFLVLLVSLLEA